MFVHIYVVCIVYTSYLCLYVASLTETRRRLKDILSSLRYYMYCITFASSCFCCINVFSNAKISSRKTLTSCCNTTALARSLFDVNCCFTLCLNVVAFEVCRRTWTKGGIFGSSPLAANAKAAAFSCLVFGLVSTRVEIVPAFVLDFFPGEAGYLFHTLSMYWK